ncbi:MAG: efflux RND transporter permease subunit [Rhodobacteraceae bacterium]|nr:efflux RND transporter permease subunit [Paracoccaceae bacterium]
MKLPQAQSFTSFFDYMVRHRTAANLILAIMVVAGVFAGLKIRTQYFPDIIFDEINVSVSWSGAGPEDMDEAVVEILGAKLLAVEGVDSATFIAREGRASFELEFESDTDMGQAADDVKSVVDTARSSLPDGIDDPVVKRAGFSDRVTNVVIFGPIDIDQLSQFAEELQTKLFREGVTGVTIQGSPNPLIRIDTPEAQLVQHNLTLADISAIVEGEMETTPAGSISGGSARLRTGETRRTKEDLGNIIVKSTEAGEKLQLRSIANIITEGAESGVAYSHKGMPAILLRVSRDASGDTVGIQKQVEDVVADMQTDLPNGVEVRLTETRAQAISDRLDILVKNGLTGLALVLAFLFLFLSGRTAFWVAAGIPVAMAATIGIMYVMGLTLNMLSLFALIICLGIVVDDAIVVGEHADFLSRKGYSPEQAASLAAKRMLGPVFSASITTVIAFSGLLAIGGRFGDLIVDIPLTVSVVMVASLVESFLILPAHMRHALSASSKPAWYDWPNRIFDRGFSWFRRTLFRPFIARVIEWRYAVLGITVMLVMVTASMYFDGTVKWRFFSSPERNVINANFAMLPGASRSDTTAMVREMERALDVVDQRFEDEYGRPPVDFALSKIGAVSGWGFPAGDTKDEDELGSMAIELLDPDKRPYSAYEFIGAWQKEIKEPPLLETLAVRGSFGGPSGDAIDVRLYGTSTNVLKEAAEYLKQALASLDGVSGLEDTLSYDKPEINLALTPKGQALGVTSNDIAKTLRQRLEGIEVAEFPVGRRTATVRVGLPENETNAAFVYDTRLRVSDGNYIALSELVTIDRSYGFSSVRREDGLRTLQVTGAVSEDDPAAAQQVTKVLEETLLPELQSRFGVESVLGGRAQQERDFLSDAVLAFGLCMIGIYLVLCWIFASWSRPLVIMAVIPTGVIGMVWGHYIHGIAISMFSIVGFVGMAGIIINDSIVLVTTIDEYRLDRPFRQALIDGVTDRLRAVILTSATTVFGLAPLLFETSRQAQFLLPTVVTLAYGLGVGLFVVILVTPALLAAQHDFGQSITSGRRLFQHGVKRRKSLGSQAT